MNDFKSGMMMAFGAATAFTLLVALFASGTVAYSYFTTDYDRLALAEKVQVACRNGRGKFREPPASMSVFQQHDYLESQKDGLAECGEAKMRLLAYDLETETSKRRQ